MKDIRQKLLATFQVEHRDHVEQIRSLLAMIDKTGGQPPGAELEEAFRRAHSLKGAARAVDLRPVEGLAHRLETLFSRVRQGGMLLDREVTGVVQQALDAMEDCVAGLGENRPSPGFEAALRGIERALGMESDTAVAAGAEPAASLPFQPLATVRITAQNFDGLLRSAGGLLAESQRLGRMTVELSAITRQISDVEREAERARKDSAAAERRFGAPRDFSRLSPRLDSLERQARSLSRQVRALLRSQQRSSWTMSRLGRQLQEDVWQARMVPAESLFEGYRKMMRDLARDESKEIEFRTVSAGVHADRGVLELLKDPLMHLLRNAVSHGIETPRERTARGKSPAGLVSLRMNSEGQRLTIAIEDDGRGLDLPRVAEVAVKQGIVAEADVARTSRQELARIVFRPGFSTSRLVTDLSGRGMGLSVVYETVRRLQGEVDLRPGTGGGTAIHISVPLSISTHRLLLLSCCGRRFAIPIHAIERLHRIKRQSIETVEGKPVVILEDKPLPLFTMRHLLRLDDPSSRPGPEVLPVVVLRSRGGRTAVVVDAFLGESDAVIQDLGPAAPPDGKVSGGIMLDDGTIALVLNPVELLETSTRPEPAFLLNPPEPAPEQQPGSVLVVDDSLTTRTLEKSILEAHGYRVRLAVDGLDALAQLRSEEADLVIADIQMPRLDGFGLLDAIKKDQRLHHIPVIVVTSLERREDQERGLALGADAYIVKRKFDQGELLATIRQIL